MTPRDLAGDARAFEETFDYGDGLLPTPKAWIDGFWRQFTQDTLKRLEAPLAEAGRVLFVGVGRGDIPRAVPAEQRLFIGFDLNESFLLDASLHCEAQLADAVAAPYMSESFDLVICNMVLHHITGQGGLERCLAECARVTRPGGQLFVLEPNLYHPSGLLLNAMNAFHLYHRIAGGSDYEYALSPYKLKKICERSYGQVSLEAYTHSHPRFPRAIQRLARRLDTPLRAWPGASFCFSLIARR